MKKLTKIAIILLATMPVAVGAAVSGAGDPAAGKVVFETRCHTCHAALPYTGRVGEANLAAFLRNPRRYNPKTAMTFPGLKSKKDIDDVIAYITGGY
jgi:cytochrome c2